MKNYERVRENHSNGNRVPISKSRKWIVPIVVVGVSAIVAIAPANAALISWSADTFDEDGDISTNGDLVLAINEGQDAVAVTVNGVTFAANSGTASFFTNGGLDRNYVDRYTGGAIGSLGDANAQALLDTYEFGPGIGNSLARISDLILGQAYELQVLLVDSINNKPMGFGYATPSGNSEKVYELRGVNVRSPVVFTGKFIADETSQDVHIAVNTTSPANGEACAYQLRKVVPEPSTLLMSILGVASGLGLALFRRRKR